MGIASASFTICIRDEDPIVVAEQLLHILGSGLVVPKSMELHLPGRKFAKIPNSLDAEVFWGREDLPNSLPGEEMLLGTEFTALGDAERWLTLPRDNSEILNRLRTYLGESAQLWRNKVAVHDDVYWTFWGPCKLHYWTNGVAARGFVLRQRLHHAQRLEPILRVTCHLARYPRSEFILRLFTRCFVWSHSTSNFDPINREWIPKTNLEIERENAVFAAETVSMFVHSYSNAEVVWDTHQEHTPDLRGFLAIEFENRFGPRGIPHKVKDGPPL